MMNCFKGSSPRVLVVVILRSLPRLIVSVIKADRVNFPVVNLYNFNKPIRFSTILIAQKISVSRNAKNEKEANSERHAFHM